MKSDFYVKCLSESESSSLPRVGLTRSDVGYMASASGDRNLDAEHLARNRIVKVSDDQFSCALCEQKLWDEKAIETHLKSKRHQRYLRNEEWWENPLSDVPDPHRAFTRRNEEGWPVCTLCHKRMENKHWTSAKHVAAVNYVLQLEQGIAGWYTQPPLPQPPPPPRAPAEGAIDHTAANQLMQHLDARLDRMEEGVKRETKQALVDDPGCRPMEQAHSDECLKQKSEPALVDEVSCRRLGEVSVRVDEGMHGREEVDLQELHQQS